MLVRVGLVSLVALASSLFALAPIPNNTTYIGINKTIDVVNTSYSNDDLVVVSGLGGGSFRGSVNGFDTAFWCVDSQTNFNPASPAEQGNVILLGDINTSGDSRVRFANSGTTFANSFGSLGTSFTTAATRYRAAAWLIERYNYEVAGDEQSGIRNTNTTTTNLNRDIQAAIWSLTYNGVNNNGYNVGNNNSWAVQALNAVKPVGLNDWAVVTWDIDVDGNGPDTATARQTFLVQVVPEPGFYGVLAAGLSGLAFAVRRRKQSV